MISKCANILCRHRRSTIISAVVIIFVSLFLVSKGNFSNDILDMLPLEDRIISRHFRFLSLFNMMDRIVFEMSIEDSTKTFEQLATATRAVIDRLKESNKFVFMGDISSEDFFQLRNLIIRQWPNLFTKKDSVWVSERLNKDSLNARFDRTISGLFTLSDAASDAFILQRDPFGLAQFSIAKLAAFKPAENITIEEGFVTNRAHNRILFFAHSKKPGMDDSNARAIQKIIETVEEYARDNGFHLTWMGAIRASRDNTDIIQRDVHLTLPIAFILILLICFLIYSRFYFGLLTFLPTLLGILITFAAFSYFGKLSIIILGFGAALLGITVDYAVHYLYHIDDVPQDKNPVKTLTGPIFASAFTTAGAFLVLIVAGIPGLAQLGTVTATGIVIVAAVSLTILPIFSNSSGKKPSHKQRIKPAAWFASFYSGGYDRKFVIPLLVITAVVCFFIPRLSFDGDPDSLNGMKPATVAAEKSLEKNWSGLQNGVFLVVTDTSCKAVCRKAELQLKPLVDTLTSLGVINPAALFTLLLPPEEVQQQNRIRWRETFTSDKIGSMRKAINSITAKYDLELSRFYQYLTNISSCDSMEVITLKDFPVSFKNGLLKNYLRSDDSQWYANIPVFPTADSLWVDIDRLAQQSNILAVNDAMLGLRVVDIIKTGFFRCLIYIPFVICCILLIMLRSIRYTLVALFPTFLATGITLGVMAICHIPVNIVSLMIFAFIFGLGIDYALLMLYMSRKAIAEDNRYIYHGAASITVAACTTLAGLGVLSIAQHPVLSALGRTGMIGIISSYVCAVVFVPMMVERFGSSKTSHINNQ